MLARGPLDRRCFLATEPGHVDGRQEDQRQDGGDHEPDLDLKVPVTGSAWGATSHPADRLDVPVEGQEDLDLGVGRSGIHDLRRDLEDSVAAVLTRYTKDHLACPDDLAGLGAARRDRAGAVGVELVPAQPAQAKQSPVAVEGVPRVEDRGVLELSAVSVTLRKRSECVPTSPGPSLPGR
jgi:hypothetical protein